jgi:hypothetical protein
MIEPSTTLDEAKAIVETKRAPRVTEQSIKSKIEEVTYTFHAHMTICVITMKNGFFVVGKAAPADPQNYDIQVGMRYAYEDAFKQLWQLEGYLLREHLYEREVDAGLA